MQLLVKPVSQQLSPPFNKIIKQKLQGCRHHHACSALPSAFRGDSGRKRDRSGDEALPS